MSSACEADDRLTWDDRVVTDDLVVVRKPNVGYDFGSWSVAMSLMPSIATSDRLIIANDSMVGPFVSLRPALEQFESHDGRRMGADGLDVSTASSAVILSRLPGRRPRSKADPEVLGRDP